MSGMRFDVTPESWEADIVVERNHMFDFKNDS